MEGFFVLCMRTRERNGAFGTQESVCCLADRPLLHASPFATLLPTSFIYEHMGESRLSPTRTVVRSVVPLVTTGSCHLNPTIVHVPEPPTHHAPPLDQPPPEETCAQFRQRLDEVRPVEEAAGWGIPGCTPS